jgi:hypothetical protein
MKYLKLGTFFSMNLMLERALAELRSQDQSIYGNIWFGKRTNPQND